MSAGGTVTYSYDALGRLTQVTYPNGVTVTYALDAAGNRTNVTTTQPPSAPGTPTFSSITGSTATAAWTAPSSGTAPTGYEYTLNDGTSWTSVGTALSANLSGLANDGTQYTFSVRAYDAEGGRGSESTATFSTAPSAPGTVAISNIGETTATASWGAATDAGGVAGYEYSLNGGSSWTNVGNTLTVNLSGLIGETQYTFSVRAYDGAGNRGPSSSSTFTTATVVPSTPTGLSATVAGDNQVNLSWNASTDSGGPGLAGYYVYRNGSKIGTAISTSFSDTGVSPFNTYSYTVAAYDTQGHASATSSAASASTYYTITNSSGALLSSASSLYSESTTVMNPRGGTVYQWEVLELVGSKVTAADTVNSSSPGCGTGATVRSVASGYQLSGCVLIAEPSVYGH